MSAFPPREFIQDKIDKMKVGDRKSLPELCEHFWDPMDNEDKKKQAKDFKAEVDKGIWPNLRSETVSASKRTGDQQYIRT
jgi:hypothetical protein